MSSFKCSIKSLTLGLMILFFGISCQASSQSAPVQKTENEIDQENLDQSDPEADPSLASIPNRTLIQPDDLIYRGFFRLPEGSGNSNWEYSGHGLTYSPGGDPEGEEDDFPGSLFGFGHDHQLLVSEINIPAPVITRNLAEAPTATTLQPFADLTGGIFAAQEMTIPRAGLAYLADPVPRLYFAFGQHFQDFESSHGWAGLDLDQPDSRGAWLFGEYTNYVTNDYLFEIPPIWAEAIAPGPLLASGRAREGLWSGRGPALFAYNPVGVLGVGDLPGPGEVLNGILPLLLFGEQLPDQPDIVSNPSQAVNDYRDADHWWGGAWLTVGDAAGVVLAGTKAVGEEWYGFANGVVWEHDCAESQPPTCPEVPEWPFDNRGFWATDFRAEMIFFDPSELAAVARGEMDSWIPQPYATLVLDEYLLAPELDQEIYKRDLVGAMAFDRENSLIYLVERLADEYKSIIHVWEILP
jgi:hypothetical protein